MKLRQLTREDWNDISKLRFRDSPAKIIDAKVFDNAINKIAHPVVAIVQILDSYLTMNFALNGQTNLSRQNNEDIVIEEPEEVNYEEIIKELMVKNAFLKLGSGVIRRIEAIDCSDNTFHWRLWNNFESIKDTEISFDLKTFYTFNEYLELRRKENE
jgi:hypothetical protein